MTRPITATDIEELTRRRKPGTLPPPIKTAGFIASIIGLLIVCGGVVWSLATLVTGKADAHDVDEIRLDVREIKTEQRILIRAIRPLLKEER